MHGKYPRKLCLSLCPPLYEAVNGNETPASEKRIFPDAAIKQGFTLGKDGGHFEFLGIVYEWRQKAPEHHRQHASAELFVPGDDRLHRLRRDVVMRCEF